jgi:hypothetical protein
MIHRSLLTLTLLALALSCGKQGEGQRCSTKNDSEDCDTNLTCRAPLTGVSCDDEPTNPTCLPSLCCTTGRSSVQACNDYQIGVGNNTGTGGTTSVGTGETGGSATGGNSGIINTETGGSATGGSTSVASDAGTLDAG